MKAAVVKCDPLKYLYENSLHKKELQQNICFKLQKVIFGKSNPAYNICLGFYYKFIIAIHCKRQTYWMRVKEARYKFVVKYTKECIVGHPLGNQSSVSSSVSVCCYYIVFHQPNQTFSLPDMKPWIMSFSSGQSKKLEV